MSQPTSGRIRHRHGIQRRERASSGARRHQEELSPEFSPQARAHAIAHRIQQTRADRRTQEFYDSLIAQAEQERERDQAEFEQSQRRSSISRGKRVVVDDGDSSEDPTYQVENEERSEIKEYIDEFARSTVQGETPRDEPDRTAEAYYLEALLSRDFKGTRYPHKPTMGALGIVRDMSQLLINTGMQKLMTTFSDGYKEETCHFLATLALHFDDDEMQGYITFSVKGQEYELSMMEVNEVYVFPNDGNADNIPAYDGNELSSLWATIGVGAFEAGKSKCSGIRNPVLRYFHKVVANTMFAKETTGNVTEGELGLMATALKPIMHYTTDGYPMRGDLANSSMTRILLENLLSYKGWAVSNYGRKIKGTLLVGGIVTPILRACNVPLRGKGTPARMIDLSYLKNSHFFHGTIAEQKYQFTHPEFGTSLLLLPNEDLTTIRTGINIDFQPSKETLFSYKGKAKVNQPKDVVHDVEMLNVTPHFRSTLLTKTEVVTSITKTNSAEPRKYIPVHWNIIPRLNEIISEIGEEEVRTVV